VGAHPLLLAATVLLAVVSSLAASSPGGSSASAQDAPSQSEEATPQEAVADQTPEPSPTEPTAPTIETSSPDSSADSEPTTPVEQPAITPTVEESPTPQATDTPIPTDVVEPTPTPEIVASDATGDTIALALTVDGEQGPLPLVDAHEATAGARQVYRHALKIGVSPNETVLGIAPTSSLVWPVELLDKNGTPLPDVDADGIREIPDLQPDQPVEFQLAVDVPADGPIGAADATTLALYLKTDDQPLRLDLVTDTTTIVPAANQPDATASPTTAPTPPPIEPATETPEAGSVDLTLLRERRRGDPGGTVDFDATVHNGDVGQVVNLTADPDADWSAKLLSTSGDPLSDSDGDGAPDTGYLEPGHRREIVLQVDVPDDALADSHGSVILATLSVGSGSVPASVSATVYVRDSTSVEVSGNGASFGVVGPDGRIDPAVDGVTSNADQLGATYTKNGAIDLTVTSNGDWSISCGVAGIANGGALGAARFEWRAGDDGVWTEFRPEGQSAICAQGGAGTTVIEIDLRMRVLWSDLPGDLGGNFIVILDG
jgi:hypothetical protein